MMHVGLSGAQATMGLLIPLRCSHLSTAAAMFGMHGAEGRAGAHAPAHGGRVRTLSLTTQSSPSPPRASLVASAGCAGRPGPGHCVRVWSREP